LKKGFTLFLALAAVVLSGCGGGKAGSIVTSTYYNPNAAVTEHVEATEKDEIAAAATADALSSDQFMILATDATSECIIVEQLVSGKQYMYNYTLTTDFLDKYGNRCSISQFDPGRVITIGDRDSKGRVGTVKLSTEVWEYPDVTNYEADEDRGVLVIGDESYSCGSDVYINSDGRTMKLADLMALDTIRVIGFGKNIISISVTSGHGELTLTNTDIFEGSYIQIGSRIFERITPNMTIEIPEGTYTVAVANKGYGGSTEITIERGEKEKLNLDTIKGDGPKTGQILFAVDVTDALLSVDGELIDYSEPVELTYGVHSLVVNATGYETYDKKLVVNSDEATIVIGMGTSSGTSSTDSTSSGTTSSTGTTSDGTTGNSSTTTDTSGSASTATAGSLAGSLAGSNTSTGNTSGSTSSSSLLSDSLDSATVSALVDDLLDDDDDDDTSDYLSTLTELLKSISSSSD
jgi:hypothetical protein